MRKVFNPNDFFETIKLKDVIEKFPEFYKMDFSIFSLNEELIKRNYEIVSSTYQDKKYSSVNEYMNLEVDTVV
jgi:hypothetical protein